MKKSFLFALTLSSLISVQALACMGGGQSALFVGDKQVGTLNKSGRALELAEGSKFTFIGNCTADNPDADLSLRVLDLKPAIEAEENVCVGISADGVESKFGFTIQQMTSISRSMGCGGKIAPLK